MNIRDLICASVPAACALCNSWSGSRRETPMREAVPSTSTSTTVADTSAATPGDWVHIDVALRGMIDGAR